MLDAVIIGAGHNGLVAAAYLARAGLSVECLERRDVAGGACVTEELWPGVRASPGAYTLSLLRREIIAELDLAVHGLHVDVHEPYLFAPFPDGRRVVTWSQRERTRAQLARDWSQEDADGYAAWSERWEAAAARARPLMLEPPDRERWLEAVGPEILDGSIADDLAGIPSPEVRVPFAIQGLIGSLAGPRDPGTAFVGFYHDLGEAAGSAGAWGFARGGMGAVTGALRSAAEAAGARVTVDAPVERVRQGRRAGGRGGARGRARGGGPGRALQRRPAAHRGARRGTCRPTGWRQAGPVVKVMVLLDGLPDFPAWPGEEPWHGTIDIGFTLEDLETRRGRRPRRASRRRGRGSRPPARPRAIRRSRPRAGTCSRCSASASRPTSTPTRRPTPRSLASPRSARRSRTGSSSASRSDRASSRPASASPAGTSSTARCCPASCWSPGSGRGASAGSRGSTWPGSGAHPGGAVTGAPGYLAARAVIEDLAS